MSGTTVTYVGAAAAGVLSFASPCVLPLVPAYVSFLGGASVETLADAERDPAVTRRAVRAALAFTAGFVAVFVLLGATATTLGNAIADHLGLLTKISGLVVILFGLHYAGLLRAPVLYRELRIHPRGGRTGVAGGLVMGLAFAFGWTPCVGPVLATILLLAGRSASLWQGVTLLTCYGLGLGLPFVAAAAAMRPFLRLAARMRARARLVEAALGALLVATGAMIFVGSVADVGGWLLHTFPALSRVG